MLVHGLRLTSHSLNEDVMLCYEYNNENNINSIQDKHIGVGAGGDRGIGPPTFRTGGIIPPHFVL